MALFKKSLTPETPAEATFSWGPYKLTDEQCEGHFAAIATTGGGKGLTISLLQQDVLKRVGKGEGVRTLIVDAKQDTYPIVAASCDERLIKTFNPFDKRGVAWWISRDLDQSAVIIQFANALIPDKNDTQPFFPAAARDLTWGVCTSFRLSGIDWRFSDLLRALRSRSTCKRILARHPETSYLIPLYLRDPKLSSDIIATVGASLKIYEPVAASWDHANERIAIRDFMDQEFVIILGNVEVARVAVDRINAVIWKRFSDLVLTQPDSTHPGATQKRFWVFIDELSETQLVYLPTFVKKARSKGGRCCVAFQSTEGLKKSSLYGEHGTKDLLSCLDNKFVGRLACDATSNWITSLIGEREIEQTSQTESYGRSSSQSTTTSRVIQKTLLPSELTTLASSGKSNGLQGLFMVRDSNPRWARIPAQELFNKLLLPPVAGIPEFIQRDTEFQELQPWSAEEIEIFSPKPAPKKPIPPKNSKKFEPEDF